MPYEMGSMPEAAEGDELELEGSEYEAPEEETSPLDELKARVSELDLEGLRELEAAVASEISSKEESDESDKSEEEPEAEGSEESDLGGLGSLFS